MIIACSCGDKEPCGIKLNLYANLGRDKAELRFTDRVGNHTSMYLDASALVALVNAAHQAMDRMLSVET